MIDTSGYASAAGHNRLMFLCKYDNHFVQLLDVIGQAYVGPYGMDFKPITADKDKSCITNCPPGQIIIQDFDHDGTPEIEMIISTGFKLYFEITNNRLQVDLNPELYKPLFEREKLKKTKRKSDAYYIYGFLINELKLEKIKTMLKADRKQYKMVVTILKTVEQWNAVFHNAGGEKFVLKQYNLKRR
ncbi:MAG: hypothetical protein HY957_02000 [Nitrospirae bacterium]|nr:hypothetical protein [Nitrospirota bacterium]